MILYTVAILNNIEMNSNTTFDVLMILKDKHLTAFLSLVNTEHHLVLH